MLKISARCTQNSFMYEKMELKYQKSINWRVPICESQFARIPILMSAVVSFDSKLTKTHIS